MTKSNITTLTPITLKNKSKNKPEVLIEKTSDVQLTSEIAFYLSEINDFTPVHEQDDSLEAEATVNNS